MSVKRRITISLLFILALLSPLGYTAYHRRAAAAVAATPPPPPTIPVTRGEVALTVTAPGRLVGVQETVLSLPVGGRLVALDARPGQVVRAGDVLARVDDAPYRAALRRAQLALDQATAQHAHDLAEMALAAESGRAQVDAARAGFDPLTAAELAVQAAVEEEARALNEYNKALDRPWEPADVVEVYRLEHVAAQRRRAVAEADLAAAQNRRWAAGEEVAARQADLSRAEAELAYRTGRGVDPLLRLAVAQAEADLAGVALTAPFDGVVLDVAVRPGETVAAGQTLLLLADPAAVEAETTVIEEDLPLVRPGQPAELFFDARPAVAVTARVARIVPRRVPNEDRPLYTVYLTLDDAPPAGVLPGMTVDAAILIDRRADALRLPRALLPAGSDTATVEVWRDGRRHSRAVEVGLRGDVYTELLAGLKEGEAVVAE